MRCYMINNIVKKIFVNFIIVLVFSGCASIPMSWGNYENDKNYCERYDDKTEKKSCKVYETVYKRIDKTCKKLAIDYDECIAINIGMWWTKSFYSDLSISDAKSFTINCYDKENNLKPCKRL